jgi:serine/threonine-protein kinase
MATTCPSCRLDNPDTSRFCGACGSLLKPTTGTIPAPPTAVRTAAPALTTGALFAGRYQVIEELGKGGMGTVFKVFDTEIKAKVALKLIKSNIAADAAMIERFRNEIRTARGISHKHVCRMYDLGKDEGTFFITMEYVAGEDLRDMIRMSRQLAVGTAVAIARQICDGLEEAHRIGVVHRDLKPANIMIDRQGNAKIMDFGIARTASWSIGEREVVGTPEYMSPEQSSGGDADHRADIYSLGVLLFEALTGRVPFAGEDGMSVVLKHRTETPSDPRKFNPQVPELLSRLVLKCLEKRPSNRYQSVGELSSDLEKIAKSVHPPGAWKDAETAGTKGDSDSSGKYTIAVLPFANMSPEPGQDYFCDGLAEEILNALSKIRDFRVVARTSVFSFKGKNVDIRDIGRTFDADSVLEGSVRKKGDRVRITVRLVNVADGTQLWSESYDRDLVDIFAVQEEITLAILDKFQFKLRASEKERLLKRYTENVEAYEDYLKGRYFWNGRYAGGLKKALEFFHAAIGKDPLHAPSYAGIADSFSILGMYGLVQPKVAYTKAKEAIRKALEIDDQLGEAYASLGFVSMFYDWDWEATEAHFTRALAINPNDAIAHIWYSLYYYAMGRYEEALREARRAQKLEPLSLVINTLVGVALFGAGRRDEAFRFFESVSEMDPDFSFNLIYLGGAYMATARWPEAVAAYEKLMTLSNAPFNLGILGFAYASAGEKEKAEKALDELARLAKERYVSPYYFSVIWAGLGDADKTFHYLERAYEERESFLAVLRRWPFFDGFGDDPRLLSIEKKIGLPS